MAEHSADQVGGRLSLGHDTIRQVNGKFLFKTKQQLYAFQTANPKIALERGLQRHPTQGLVRAQFGK